MLEITLYDEDGGGGLLDWSIDEYVSPLTFFGGWIVIAAFGVIDRWPSFDSNVCDVWDLSPLIDRRIPYYMMPCCN